MNIGETAVELEKVPLEKLVDWFISFDWITALSIIVGLIGVVFGVALTEYFRRKERRLIFSEKYLERKTQLYEELYKSLVDARKEWSEISEKNPSQETIKKEFSKTVFEVADLLDQNALYVNEVILTHIMLIFVGFLDYPLMKSKEQKKYVDNTNKSWKQIFDGIREDLGFVRIDQELKSLGSSGTELRSMEDYLASFKQKG